MARFWVSWWSSGKPEDNCSKPPIQTWTSDEVVENNKIICSFCAVIEAENPDEVWQDILKYYPDCERRFCIKRPDDFTPPSQFNDFKEKVSFKPVKKVKRDKLPLEVREALIEAERNLVKVTVPHKKGVKPKCQKMNRKKNKTFCARSHP